MSKKNKSMIINPKKTKNKQPTDVETKKHCAVMVKILKFNSKQRPIHVQDYDAIAL